MSICLIYDDSPQPWGPFSMPTYFMRAARRLQISHGWVRHERSIDNADFDLFLFLDDSQHFEPIDDIYHPCAVYVTDTHAGGYAQRLRRAEKADFVFACHLSGVEKLSLDLQREVHWLPVACDPERHAEGAQPPNHRTKEVVFVGNFGTTSTGEFGLRSEWLKAAKQVCTDLDIHFHFSQKYAKDAFEPYKRALVALNFPCNHDLNMRVFEAIAGGAFLLTQPIEMNSMGKLGLDRGFNYGVFENTDELRYYLQVILSDVDDFAQRAEQAHAIIKKHHTYDDRLKQILETCGIENV